MHLLVKGFTRILLIEFLQLCPIKKFFFEQYGLVVFCESAKHSPVWASLSLSVQGNKRNRIKLNTVK